MRCVQMTSPKDGFRPYTWGRAVQRSGLSKAARDVLRAIGFELFNDERSKEITKADLADLVGYTDARSLDKPIAEAISAGWLEVEKRPGKGHVYLACDPCGKTAPLRKNRPPRKNNTPAEKPGGTPAEKPGGTPAEKPGGSYKEDRARKTLSGSSDSSPTKNPGEGADGVWLAEEFAKRGVRIPVGANPPELIALDIKRGLPPDENFRRWCEARMGSYGARSGKKQSWPSWLVEDAAKRRGLLEVEKPRNALRRADDEEGQRVLEEMLANAKTVYIGSDE